MANSAPTPLPTDGIGVGVAARVGVVVAVGADVGVAVGVDVGVDVGVNVGVTVVVAVGNGVPVGVGAVGAACVEQADDDAVAGVAVGAESDEMTRSTCCTAPTANGIEGRDVPFTTGVAAMPFMKKKIGSLLFPP
jgi:hypothetical protein